MDTSQASVNSVAAAPVLWERWLEVMIFFLFLNFIFSLYLEAHMAVGCSGGVESVRL